MRNIQISISAAPSKQRSGRWGDREQSILDAAWELITSQGFDRMTMADVAAATGLSEGSLYNYVPSKRELAIRVAERWFSTQAEELEQTLSAVEHPRDQVTLLVQRHIAMILEQPELFLMWIREVRATDAYLTSSSRDIFRSYTGLLRAVLDKAQVAGSIETDMSNDMVRDMVYGGAEHVAWTAIVQKRASMLDVADAAKKLGSTYWRALRAETTPDGSTDERLARIEAKLDALT
ncbi:MAG: TetR/AcrR family transcriptional regulator [Rhodobiaceae bacterium]|nr:TetR/AcrR family transcriptional regulator [Rhodobiaceae bacterium]